MEKTGSRVGGVYREVGSLLGALLLGGVGAVWLTRAVVRQVAKWTLTRIMTDDYAENMAEFYSASRRMGVQNIMETNLRAETGTALARPMGSPRAMPDFTALMFNVAQLTTLPTPREVFIDLSTVIGPQAARPLKLKSPILVSAMAYGEALSAKVKIALAKGVTLAGGAINSGEGPFLPAERRAAKHYIMQYNRASWGKEREALKQADAIEIQIGQGAMGGVGHCISPGEIDAPLYKALKIPRGQAAVIAARQKHTASPEEFGDFVDRLRALTSGVPIGAKIAAGMDIESDITFLVKSGVDFITIDGAQAATKGSAPILQDDFGLPTVVALCRAVGQLERLRARERVSLIVGGGLFTPGDFLKALALGADAVYIGTAALFAVTHTQTLKALPYEPPTEVVWYTGRYAAQFNVEKGAQHLANFLLACQDEMAQGVQALGKVSLSQVCGDDLAGLTPHICEITNVRPAWLRETRHR